MCAFCGKPSGTSERVGFSDLCPHCKAELHSCINCAFYAPGRHRDCTETIDASVPDKEKRNYCEWFRPGPALLLHGSGKKQSEAAKARESFNKLFND